MATIATLTMNPALDIATGVARVVPTAKLRCDAPHHNAGGGGINVARVARRFGAEVIALFTAGGASGARLAILAGEEGLAVQTVPIAQETRQSFTVTDKTNGEQYRFVLPGPTVDDAEEAAALAAVDALEAPAFLVHSGSLPPGTSARFMARLAATAARIGARLVVDGPAAVLEQCSGAFLVKPNLVELEMLAGRPLPQRAEQAAFAREVIAAGTAQHVVLSLGEDGSLLVSADRVLHYSTPPVTLVSAVGAGDSMVGALLAALARGVDLDDAVAEGTAAGAAALLTPDTELSRPQDARRLLAQVRRVALAGA